MFESMGGGVIYHTNTKQQKACVTILSDKVDFKTKSISRGKEGDLIVINWPLHQDITILKQIYSTISLQSTE